MNRFYSSPGLSYSHSKDTTEPSGSLKLSHCHDEYEILYIIEGNGTFLVEGTEYDMKPGTLILTFPFAYHSIMAFPEHVYERHVINFALSSLPSKVQEFLLEMTPSESRGCNYYPPSAVTRSLISAIDRFETADALTPEKRDLYLRALLSEIILLLSAADANPVRQDGRELGARVIRYLNENIERDMDLDTIAKHFFVSKYYLCRAFKKHNGISVHGYITQKRVLYAKQLIEQGESASGAAYRVGFGDYSAFYRAYVKLVGKSPVTRAKEGKTDEK